MEEKSVTGEITRIKDELCNIFDKKTASKIAMAIYRQLLNERKAEVKVETKED